MKSTSKLIRQQSNKQNKTKQNKKLGTIEKYGWNIKNYSMVVLAYGRLYRYITILVAIHLPTVGKIILVAPPSFSEPPKRPARIGLRCVK